MTTDFKIRPATLDDLDFLAETIINAEKSNSDKLSFTTLFNIPEADVAPLLIAMLDEEIDGCEFSVSSFLIVCDQDKAVGALAGWIEGLDGEVTSSLLKSNLISYVFPQENIDYVKDKGTLISDLMIERKINSLQIEYLYVAPSYRGKKLAEKLFEAHFKRALEKVNLKKAQIQVFSNNFGAIYLYEYLGFKRIESHVSKNQDIFKYLAHNEKLLMEKTFL